MHEYICRFFSPCSVVLAGDHERLTHSKNNMMRAINIMPQHYKDFNNKKKTSTHQRPLIKSEFHGK